jgi:hypothetical protein
MANPLRVFSSIVQHQLANDIDHYNMDSKGNLTPKTGVGKALGRLKETKDKTANVTRKFLKSMKQANQLLLNSTEYQEATTVDKKDDYWRAKFGQLDREESSFAISAVKNLAEEHDITSGDKEVLLDAFRYLNANEAHVKQMTQAFDEAGITSEDRNNFGAFMNEMTSMQEGGKPLELESYHPISGSKNEIFRSLNKIFPVLENLHRENPKLTQEHLTRFGMGDKPLPLETTTLVFKKIEDYRASKIRKQTSKVEKFLKSKGITSQDLKHLPQILSQINELNTEADLKELFNSFLAGGANEALCQSMERISPALEELTVLCVGLPIESLTKLGLPENPTTLDSAKSKLRFVSKIKELEASHGAEELKNFLSFATLSPQTSSVEEIDSKFHSYLRAKPAIKKVQELVIILNARPKHTEKLDKALAGLDSNKDLRTIRYLPGGKYAELYKGDEQLTPEYLYDIISEAKKNGLSNEDLVRIGLPRGLIISEETIEGFKALRTLAGLSQDRAHLKEFAKTLTRAELGDSKVVLKEHRRYIRSEKKEQLERAKKAELVQYVQKFRNEITEDGVESLQNFLETAPLSMRNNTFYFSEFHDLCSEGLIPQISTKLVDFYNEIIHLYEGDDSRYVENILGFSLAEISQFIDLIEIDKQLSQIPGIFSNPSVQAYFSTRLERSDSFIHSRNISEKRRQIAKAAQSTIAEINRLNQKISETIQAPQKLEITTLEDIPEQIPQLEAALSELEKSAKAEDFDVFCNTGSDPYIGVTVTNALVKAEKEFEQRIIQMEYQYTALKNHPKAEAFFASEKGQLLTQKYKQVMCDAQLRDLAIEMKLGNSWVTTEAKIQRVCKQFHVNFEGVNYLSSDTLKDKTNEEITEMISKATPTVKILEAMRVLLYNTDYKTPEGEDIMAFQRNIRGFIQACNTYLARNQVNPADYLNRMRAAGKA